MKSTKNYSFKWHGERTSITTRTTNRDLEAEAMGSLGAKLPATGQFSYFFGKNSHFNAICLFLEPFQI